MPGSTTRTKTRWRDSVSYDALQIVDFDTIATIGAGVNGSTAAQTQFILPVAMKFQAAACSYTAIASVLGTHFFNVVVGTGTYETSNGVAATQTLTVGAPTAGNVLTFNIGIPQSIFQTLGIQPIGLAAAPGIASVSAANVNFPFSYTVKSTDTTATILATSIVTLINQTLGVNAVLWANNAAGVITIGAITAGTNFNSVTTTAAATTGATTIAWGGATLTGGTASVGTNAVGTNDLFEYTGTNGPFAAAGTPMFALDQAIFAPVPGTSQYNQQPYVPSSYDVVYPGGTVLSLRVWTPASTGSITNFKLCLIGKIVDITNSNPNYNSLIPQLDIL